MLLKVGIIDWSHIRKITWYRFGYLYSVNSSSGDKINLLTYDYTLQSDLN